MSLQLFSEHPIPQELDKILITNSKIPIKDMTYLGNSDQSSLIILLIELLILNGYYDQLLLLLQIDQQNQYIKMIMNEIQSKKRISLEKYIEIQSLDKKFSGPRHIYSNMISNLFGQKSVQASQINQHLMQKFGINIQFMDDKIIQLRSQIKLNGMNEGILYLALDKQYGIRFPQQQSPPSTILTCRQCYNIGKQFVYDELNYKNFLNQLLKYPQYAQLYCQSCKQKYDTNDLKEYVKICEQTLKSKQASTIKNIEQQSSNIKINQQNESLACKNCYMIQEGQNQLLNSICLRCIQSQQAQEQLIQSNIQKMGRSQSNYQPNYYEESREVVCNYCQGSCNHKNTFKLSCGHVYCFQCGEKMKRQATFQCKQGICQSQFEQQSVIRQLERHRQVQETQKETNKNKQLQESIYYENGQHDKHRIEQKQSQIQSQQNLKQSNYMPLKSSQTKQQSKIHSGYCSMCGEEFTTCNSQIQMQCKSNHVIGICCFLSEYRQCMVCEHQTPYLVFKFQHEPVKKQKLQSLSDPRQLSKSPQHQQYVQEQINVIPYRQNIATIIVPQQGRTISQPKYTE